MDLDLRSVPPGCSTTSVGGVASTTARPRLAASSSALARSASSSPDPVLREKSVGTYGLTGGRRSIVDGGWVAQARDREDGTYREKTDETQEITHSLAWS